MMNLSKEYRTMKKFYILALALAACSCSVEEPGTSVTPDEKEVILRAVYSDDETKTVRQADGKVFWSPGEAISVLRKTGYSSNTQVGCYKFVSTNTEPQASVEFRGTLPDTGYDQIWAIYPYDEQNAQIRDSYDVFSGSSWLPFHQTAVAGTFPDRLYIAAATTTTNELVFNHPLGGIKFSLTTPGITKAYVKAFNDDRVAGIVSLGYNSNSGKIYADWSNQNIPEESIIDLVSADGSPFETGADYYFVMLPHNYKGFDFLFERSDGKILRRKIDKQVEIKPACFRTLMEADSGLEWVDNVLSISATSFDASDYACSFDVVGTSFSDINVTPDCDWLVLSDSKGDTKFGRTYTFLVKANYGAERNGTISFTSDGQTETFTVTQAACSRAVIPVRHNSGVIFTSTTCQKSFSMTNAFEAIKTEMGDSFNYAVIHAKDSKLYSFPTVLSGCYSVSAHPNGFIDGRTKILNNISDAEKMLTDIRSAISNTNDYYRPVTSIGVASTVDGDNIKVDVDVYGAMAGSYCIVAMLVERNVSIQQYPQSGGGNHDYIARIMFTSGLYDYETFSIPSDGATTSFTYNGTLKNTYNRDNLFVFVFVLNTYGTPPNLNLLVLPDHWTSGNRVWWYNDNSRMAPIGTKVDPELQ